MINDVKLLCKYKMNKLIHKKKKKKKLKYVICNIKKK